MNEHKIILAKICVILAKPYFMIKRNGEFKKYLKCCGLGNYGTCIDACRTTLTGLFSKYKGTDSSAKWFHGAANISAELDDTKC